jgi:hypothetical protein
MLTVDANLKAGETSTTHRFELAGLGKAPFRFTGMAEKTHQACHGAPILPGSTCDYCGTCIRYEFWCKSSDDKAFKVGCDCIHKVDDAGLVRQISAAERQLRDQKNAAAKAKKADKTKARVDAAVAKLPSVRTILSGQPHPNAYFAGEGRTLLHYVTWCLENGAGERAAAIIEKA